ncbi:MAG: RNA polymerase sigma factor [Planctomycetota bacterium]|nr:RNA polymerase sigma factor [Planctomycetota bacterium]MEC8343639.1 RNA polymerase sigma factor [Planctomycetota bacterium]
MSDDIRPLIAKCRCGDQSAMRLLIDRYSSMIFGLCCRMLGHRQDAEDAAQETFVRVFRSLHKWDDQRAFEPWLLAIAGNRCRTRLAQNAKRPRSQQLDDENSCLSYFESELTLIREEISRALTDLPSAQCEAFRYFHDHGMAYHQIAELMEVPIGTVKTWVRRVRLTLVQRLQSRGVFEGSLNGL